MQMPHAHTDATPGAGEGPGNGARKSLGRYAWISIAAAVITIGLKGGAWFVTGSVGLLSDALESLVNLAAALMALVFITLAERPPDEEHAYGHGKLEYFSSGIEGALILLAAAGIVWSAVPRLLAPQPLEEVGIGLVIAVGAAVVNLAAGLVLRQAGRRHRAITLEANANHLLTDVWTSVGVLIAVWLVARTGWLVLDPIVALVVAANIVWTGVQLVRRSTQGLIDAGLSAEEQQQIEDVLAPYREHGIEFHAVRTRQAGRRRFVSLHVLAPGQWTIQQGHDLSEGIEQALRDALPGIVTTTHIEPLDDPVSMADVPLDRA